MPPLPPNLHRTTILKTIPAWNQKTMARRDTHIRHISSRFPSQPSKDTSWVNPSLPPGATRLAQPKGSHHLGTRHNLPCPPDWTLVDEIIVTRGETARQGTVALASNSDSLIVGRPNETGQNGTASMYRYNSTTETFDQYGGNLVQGFSITPSFGASVALSPDGNVAAVGAPKSTLWGGTEGAVLTVAYNSGSDSWGNSTYLSDIAQTKSTDSAGQGIAMGTNGTGSVLALGASAAYITVSNEVPYFVGYGIDASGNVDTATDTVDGTKETGFAYSIDISGARSDDTFRAVVGAAASTTGTVSVYSVSTTLPSARWSLVHSNITISAPDNTFGQSVSISEDGTVIAAGDPENGTVRVYYDSGSEWVLIGNQVLTASSSLTSYGQAISLDRNASSSNLDGITLAIGEPGYSTPILQAAGRVSVFERVSGTWRAVGNPVVGINEYENFGNTVALARGGHYFASLGFATIGRTAIYSISPIE